jgi:hypothetical protein
MAYFFIAYAITGGERASQPPISLGLQVLCLEEAGQHNPDHTPISGHQHYSMCCLSGEGNNSLAILATVPCLHAFGLISLSQSQVFDIGQPAGFPSSAYARSRAPPFWG